jgi:excisionase family DNA binding protein
MSPDNTAPDIMTAAEVAAFLRVHIRTIRRLVAHREIPCIRVGKSVRFFRSEIESMGRKAGTHAV